MRLTRFFPRLAGVYLRHFSQPRKERLFLASLSFFVAFVIVRAITYSIHDRVGPLHDVTVGGTHIHHLVWGILLLLVVGYLWLVQVGTGEGSTSRRASRVTALLYGTGAALTLDEFALWLNLRDVYWASDGRESIDAVIIFGTLLALGRWGGAFFLESISELWRFVRQ